MTNGSIIWGCILLDLLQGLCVMENALRVIKLTSNIIWSCLSSDSFLKLNSKQ